MEGVIQQNQQKAETLQNFLSQSYMPQITSHLEQTQEYLQKEKQDYERYDQEADDLIGQLMQKKNEWSKTVQTVSTKSSKEIDLQKKAETYKKNKKNELTQKQKTIDSVLSAMRESCSKVKPDLIAKLNPPGETVTETFKKIFYVLYDQDEKTFAWDEFKKKALLLESGNDFLSRLANINLKNVPQKKKDYIKVTQIKNDTELAKLLEDKTFTLALIDFADWVTFVDTAIDMTDQREVVQVEYDKIVRDFETRGKEIQNYEKNKFLQEFWEKSLNYVEDQISFLSSLGSVFKGVGNKIEDSKSNLKVHIENFVKEANEVSEKIKNAPQV